MHGGCVVYAMSLSGHYYLNINISEHHQHVQPNSDLVKCCLAAHTNQTSSFFKKEGIVSQVLFSVNNK